jgi:hypothetical protein
MPTNVKPTFEAAPINPARKGRYFSSHTSITSATHADGGDEAHAGDLPRARDEIQQAGEPGVDEDRGGHRLDAPDFVTEPTEDEPTERSAEQKEGVDDDVPMFDRRVEGRFVQVIFRQQIAQRRLGDLRKDPHLQAVEHPPQERGGEDEHLGSAGRRECAFRHGSLQRQDAL